MLWEAALPVFTGRALVDIQREAGVTEAVARRLRDGFQLTNYLHATTRAQLTEWLKRRESGAKPPQDQLATPQNIRQSGAGGATIAPSGVSLSLPVFQSEAERRAFMLGALMVATKSHHSLGEALSTLDSALSARVRDPVLETALELAERGAGGAAQLSPDGTQG